MALTGREKATIFLSILGPVAAAKVLRYLPDELAEFIAAGIGRLPPPSAEAMNMILDEFRNHQYLPSAEKPRLENQQMKRPMTPRDKVMSSDPAVLAGVLLRERLLVASYIISLFPGELKDKVLQLMGDTKSAVESLLPHIRRIALSNEIEERVIGTLVKKIG
ncbi:MAG: hypothetical protein V1843_01285 [bacterium]